MAHPLSLETNSRSVMWVKFMHCQQKESDSSVDISELQLATTIIS